MKKPSGSSSSDSRELQCVGTLEIARPKPVGFLCGSIPVPTDEAFHGFNSALVPSTQTVTAPRYRMIPTETDLNTLPLLSSIPEKVLPIAATQSRTGDLPWENSAITSSLTRKGEALAVSGLVEYGDEIDVIAPADILKQIFKITYSKARLSIAVHRVGQTLILNTGPDVEEGEKLIRRHSNQSKCADHSLFLNFAMHSVRMEACDCPPNHRGPGQEQSCFSVLPGRFDSREGLFESCDPAAHGHAPHLPGKHDDVTQDDGSRHHSECPPVKQNNFFWGKKMNKRNKGQDTVNKVSQFKEKSRCSVKESENYKRVSNNEFLRVLFWQFYNFRLLLGSDMLIFSNEKYVAVSLHLWDVSRQVTPMTWLEAWLDNVMASVPELAICYHQDGVVQGYELLKTDDVFLLKGVSDDGTPAFHPHVVQQNGLSVLRFLQDNCKQDPGAYWLYKSAGEDVIQLFDLSIISKKHASNDCDDRSSSFPSIIHGGRSDSLLSLGTLLYRIAHRLSLSMSPDSLARCAKFIKKCLNFVDGSDHMVVRALAHEQFARLLLNCDEELDLTSEVLPEEFEMVADAEEESVDLVDGISEANVVEIVCLPGLEGEPSKGEQTSQDFDSEVSVRTTLDAYVLTPDDDTYLQDPPAVQGSADQNSVFKIPTNSPDGVQSVSDPISSKLAAVHHVSQAIKSLRWQRQLQGIRPELDPGNKTQDKLLSSIGFSVCACGDADCIEVCDIREWLLTSKLDDKLWKLVLLLGESYLALGQAYKDAGQLYQALKVVELASVIYGSMPQHLEDTRFISSMVCRKSDKVEISGRRSLINDPTELSYCTNDDCITLERFPSHLFWAKAWTLIGDVYVELHVTKGNEISSAVRKPVIKELKMSSEVLKEVKRLKKKLGQFNQNCSSCSLINCSCHCERVHSGSSASSSTGDAHRLGYVRKQNKKLYSRSNPFLNGFTEGDHAPHNGGNRKSCEVGHLKHGKGNYLKEASDIKTDTAEDRAFAAIDSMEADCMGLCYETSIIDENPKAASKEANGVRNGGIFKYLRGPVVGDVEYSLSDAVSSYKEARKALAGHLAGSVELQSVIKKIGWVCNELGRFWLERKELDKAELAFADAIDSFKEVSDHANIILINCNLGHGKRALAEEMVSNIENLNKHVIFQNAYQQSLEKAKQEYSEALRYYGAAKAELNSAADEQGLISSNLRTEVHTQFAHTYLKLGMLLAREDAVAQVYENGELEDYGSPNILKTKKERRKHEISANDAIREALSIYESLGELRKQEAAYAYYQLACYQRDCCLKFLESDQKKGNMSKGDNSVLPRVKLYASLAERNWQKSIDFYRPKTHPIMYLTILVERSALSLNLSNLFHLNMMLESAVSHLLEGRHMPEATISGPFANDNQEICAKFWSQLQMILKKMLSMILPTSSSNSSAKSRQTPSNKSGDAGKLRELYKMSLKSSDFSQLNAMHDLWTS